MIQAISTSNTGLNAGQALLDVTSNNLANLNTTGFKANQVGFQDLLYASEPAAVGRGVRVSSTDKLFAQGPLQSTGRPLDVAIEGNGFFQVTRPDGSTAYTRDGSFRVDPSGRLVTADGSLVQPAIVVPPGASSVTIGPDGTVTAVTGKTTTPVGQLTLTRFPNRPPPATAGRALWSRASWKGRTSARPAS
jgi:flagellar basal-body rod protein FlgG